MSRLPVLLLVLASVLTGFALKTLIETEQIAQFFSLYGRWIALIGLGLLGALGLGLVIGLWLLRRWVRRAVGADATLTEAQMIQGLIDTVTTPDGVRDPTPEEQRRAALVNAGLWLARRQAAQFYFNVTVSIVGGLVGAATLFLLYEQNQKIDVQNQRITLQTDAGIAQSVLLESNRRAAVASELSALLADIRNERAAIAHQACPSAPIESCYREEEHSQGRPIYHLSAALRSRVIAFALRSTPYLFSSSKTQTVDFDRPLRDQFSFLYFSPERGQLLASLVRNQISLRGLDLSYAYAPYIDLQRAYLADVDLSGANLHHANARNAVFYGARLSTADLGYSDFTRAKFLEARFTQADMRNSDFNFTTLSDSDFRGARLTSTDFEQALIVATTLQAARLFGADFANATIQKSTLLGTDLNLARFERASVTDTSFGGADLTKTTFVDFRGARNWISQADMTDFEITDAFKRASIISRGSPPIGLPVGEIWTHCDFNLSLEFLGGMATNCAEEPVQPPPPPPADSDIVTLQKI